MIRKAYYDALLKHSELLSECQVPETGLVAKQNEEEGSLRSETPSSSCSEDSDVYRKRKRARKIQKS